MSHDYSVWPPIGSISPKDQMTIKKPSNKEPIGRFASIMATLLLFAWIGTIAADRYYPHVCWRVTPLKPKAGH